MNKNLQTIDMSNVKWIHPGIGKTQSKILDILEDEVRTWGWMGIENLTSKVYYPDLRGATLWDADEYPTTKSQINSVRRAVKALGKRGLVNTMITPVESPKGIRYWRVVGILSDKYCFEEEAKEKKKETK